jgi:hypothetical protein
MDGALRALAGTLLLAVGAAATLISRKTSNTGAAILVWIAYMLSLCCGTALLAF